MVQVPKFDELTMPTDSPVLNFKNSTIFIVSTITELIGSLITLNSFSEVSFEHHILIIMLITWLILFIDVIILYVKDRENHFKNVYVTNMYQNLCNQLNSVQEQTNKLNDIINNLETSNKDLKI